MKPWHPYAVLAAAVVLPAAGQVINGKPVKGLQFLFFMILLGWLTAVTAKPEVSLIGHYAGGIFVYAVSILDAYRHARIRFEEFKSGGAARQSLDDDTP